MEAQQHRPKGHAYDEVPQQTELHSSGEDQGMQGTKIGLPTVLDDDPNAPKERPEENPPSNYQSKVTDPTGANKVEAGTTTPLVQSFEKLSVDDKEGKSKTTGKKVPMKEYLAEKFKPQEEDKALSEVISGTLFPRKKEKTEGTEGESKPTRKVTKSEEAARQKDEHGGAAAATQGEAGSGKSIMDRLKGATSSWFRKGGKEAQTPSVSNVSTEGSAAKEG